MCVDVLQLSDFKPVMKLFDLLYPEKEVRSPPVTTRALYLVNCVGRNLLLV